jgi:hypothetical protein
LIGAPAGGETPSCGRDPPRRLPTGRGERER